MKRIFLWGCIVLVTAGTVALLQDDQPNGNSDETQFSVKGKPEPETILENLDTPWNIGFLPDGTMLVTERPGTVSLVRGSEKNSIRIAGVTESGEGGLMGLALHPDFSKNRLVYAYFTAATGNRLVNRVARFELGERELLGETEIIGGIPAGQNHNGGRIAFGPDGLLYVSAGDAGRSELAQDRNSLAGKILRVRDDGSSLPDNPFGNPVYSYGHRNPQGLAWDEQGRLWATEHGRSGVQSGLDEINLIERGGNYGWPEIEGDEVRVGMTRPVVHSGRDTWAPSGLAYLEGKLYFAGLRGQALYSAEILPGGQLGQVEQILSGFGRLRAVAAGPDRKLFISTSNRDGRGTVKAGDDRIIRLSN